VGRPYTAGALIYGNGTNKLATTSAATLGQVLQFNGSIPTWVSTSSLGIVTHPAGTNGDVQFNDNGNFGAAGITWSSGQVTIPGQLELNGALNMGNGGSQALQFLDGPYSPSANAWFEIFSEANNTLTLFGETSAGAILDLNALTSDRTLTVPNASGTFGLLQAAQTWSGTNTFNQGASATTTVNFGQMGSSTSHVCFNTKDAVTGNDVSFYIANGAMVVENNSCR
jgi:hypothetical protein